MTLISCEISNVNNKNEPKSSSAKVTEIESKENECGDFKLSEISVNGINIFNLSKQQLVDTFNLFEEENKENSNVINLRDSQSLFSFDTISEEIVYFSLFVSDLSLTNTEFPLDLSEKDIQELYPKNYDQKKSTFYYETEMTTISLFDCKENEIRIYLHEGKVNHVSFLIYEDETDWEDQ